ncbi:MAG: N-formylglutamate amidohydrolase [Mariniphaga sp.]
MDKPYPLLISIPHGGIKIPPEVEGKLKLGVNDLIEDSDAFTRQIYNIDDTARKIICADVLRAIVDPNRPPDDLPPANPDGVVKSHTCYNKKIYQDGWHKDAHLIDQLLTTYYDAYHQRIQKEIQRDDIRIAFDCHSMASEAPDIAPDPGKKRPVINLGNNHGKACDNKTTGKLAVAFMEVFRLGEKHVTINEPFAGGFITRRYGNQPIPWIQIEMNRCLYLDDRWFNPSEMEINENRLKVLNQRFKKVVELFFES